MVLVVEGRVLTGLGPGLRDLEPWLVFAYYLPRPSKQSHDMGACILYLIRLHGASGNVMPKLRNMLYPLQPAMRGVSS